MIEELYPRFLGCGYSPLLFWQLSTAEIVDMLESYQRQQEQRQRQERARLRDLATVLDGVAAILLHNMFLSEGATAMHMQDVFPDLYHADPVDGSQAPQSAATDMELYKAQRLHHAYCFNKSRHKQNRGKERGEP